MKEETRFVGIVNVVFTVVLDEWGKDVFRPVFDNIEVDIPAFTDDRLELKVLASFEPTEPTILSVKIFEIHYSGELNCLLLDN